MFQEILKSLNKLLSDIGGLTPSGQPRYKWIHSSDLVIPIPDPNAELNAGWRPSSYSGLWVRDHPWKWLNYGESYTNQWVICRWDAFSPQQWVDIAGNMEGYPRNGLYSPGEFCTAPGALPTFSDTEKFVQAVKARQSKTRRQQINEEKEKMARREQRNRQNLFERVLSKAPAYIGPVAPGRGESRKFIGDPTRKDYASNATTTA